MTYIFNMIIRNEGISMKISAKGRYGLAAMTYLARNYASGSPVTIVRSSASRRSTSSRYSRC